VHKAWLLVKVDSKDEARGIVPPGFRPQTKFVQLNAFTMKNMEDILRHDRPWPHPARRPRSPFRSRWGRGSMTHSAERSRPLTMQLRGSISRPREVAERGAGLIERVKARQGCLLWTITRANRDEIPRRIRQWLGSSGTSRA
jgi:hypothetical protein